MQKSFFPVSIVSVSPAFVLCLYTCLCQPMEVLLVLVGWGGGGGM